MTVILQMKIGTKPYTNMHVKFKRKRPKIGTTVLVREHGTHNRWMSVIIDKYNDDGFCFASRH
jgi:hypothetical protein